MDERSKRNIRVGILLIAVLIALLLLRQCGENPALERVAFNRTDLPTADGVGGSSGSQNVATNNIEAERAWEYIPMSDRNLAPGSLISLDECRRRAGGFLPGDSGGQSSFAPSRNESLSGYAPGSRDAPSLLTNNVPPLASPAGNIGTLPGLPGVGGNAIPSPVLFGLPAAIGSAVPILLPSDPPADSPG